jgi:predicted AlkP superfamily pyrophosphatase or phosphodiesterase
MCEDRPLKKLLIIGLDGIRSDAVQVVNTPNLDELIENGIYCKTAITESYTTSGAAWTSLLTGVNAQKHKVLDNDFSTRDLRYPTIFKLLKDWNSTFKIVAYSNWKPIITDIFEPGVLDDFSTGNGEEMAIRLASCVKDGKADLHFVQLDDCDAAGHIYTYSTTSSEYIGIIEQTDQLVGTFIREIKKRPREEDWLICTVSDHGGQDSNHGNSSLECMQIVWIISGRSIIHKKEIIVENNKTIQPHIVDIVPTIAKFIGYPIKEYWDGIARI